MLRLLIVALPLVVALPAAFDEQEVNAFQFEVQSPLQFEVRSPPESRPLLPAATQDQHKSPATHSTPRAHHPSAPITIHAPGALARGQDDPPRDQLRHQPLRAQGHQPTTRRCARPCRQPRMQRAQLSVGRAAASARERPVHMLQAHARRPFPRLPQLCARREARRSPRAMQLALAIGTRERAALPVWLTDCALLPRCRQPQLRAGGLDGHRALDISATTGRRNVESTVTMIRPPSRTA